MTPQRIRWLAITAALLVLVAAAFAWQKSVIILADGTGYNVTTRALTVGGAVKAAGLEVGPEDVLSPSSLTWLRNGLIIDLQRASQVLLRADGEEYIRLTTERDPIALLAEFGLELGPNDRLLLAGVRVSLDEELPYSPSLLLELRRAVSVTFTADGESTQFMSSAATLGGALAEAGYTLLAADWLTPEAGTPLDGPLNATLVRSRAIEISVGDETLQLRSAAATIGEALAEAGIALQGLDRAEPAEDQPVPEDGAIRVHRVYEGVALTQQTIDFDTEWTSDPETEIDNYSVIQLGQYGIQAERVRVRYEDGVEVDRQDEGSWTLADPVTQVRGYGTKIVVRTAVVDGVTIEYWRAVTLYVTSYSPCRSGVEGQCFYGTPLGDSVQKGIAAVYRDWWYAMGNHTIYVAGYGAAKISDIGYYPTREPWIDLAYSDDDYVAWGSYETVYFTTPVPPESEILYILP